MQTTFKRSIDPTSIELTVVFDEADITSALYEQNDPDEDLFFQIFSPQWQDLTASQRLLALSKVASLVEMAQQAIELNLAADTPQDK